MQNGIKTEYLAEIDDPDDPDDDTPETVILESEEGLLYTESESTVNIIGVKDTVTELVVPATINKKDVYLQAGCFKNKSVFQFFLIYFTEHNPVILDGIPGKEYHYRTPTG